VSNKIRTLLVGCGRISHLWLEESKKLEEIELVGLVDIDEDAAKARKEQFGLTGAVTGSDYLKMLDQLKPDVVFDCTVPEAHVDITLAALDRGCHVLGEKPLADTMENARKMVAAAEKSGKTYAVIQNRRYHKPIRAFKNFLVSGKIGSLTTLNSDFYIGAHFGGFRDRMKHVLLLDMAIHTFDQARVISGADPVAVYCHEWNPKGSWYDHDASAVAVFEMSDGIVYTYRGSWCAEGLNTSWESDWRAICERGSVCWDGGENFKAQVVRETGTFFSKWDDLDLDISETDKDGGHLGVMKDFLRAIKTGSVPETICSDNIKSLAMCFAAIESAETGNRVQVRI
jgi:predicted dehydrogenase